MKVLSTFILVLALAAPAHAQQPSGGHEAHHAAASLAEGEVRRVDKETKRITIRHGRIENLDMPPMTMVFRANDPALLDQVKPGDKIRFQAEKVPGGYAITRIEAR